MQKAALPAAFLFTRFLTDCPFAVCRIEPQQAGGIARHLISLDELQNLVEDLQNLRQLMPTF